MCKVVPVLGLVLLLGVARVSGAELPGQISLSRDAAVVMAVRNNIDLRIQALNSAMAESSLARSHAIYDPYFTTAATYGDTSYPGENFGTRNTVTAIGLSQYMPTGGNISTNTQTGYTSAKDPASGLTPKDWLSSVGLTISQPLLKNAGRETMELSISLADSSHRESLEQFRFFITDTVFSVITGYNRLHVLRQIFKAREDALTSAEALRDELVRKGNPGSQQAMELANADYALSERRKDLIDAGKNVRDQEATLRYLLGIEEKTEIIPVDSPSREEPPESESEALRLAIENRPDLRQLRLQFESQQLQQRVAKHQQLLDLNVTASAGFSGIGGTVGDSFSQIGDGKGGWWSAGLVLNFPFGNTAAENDYLQSKIRTEQLQHQIKAYEWQVHNAVEADMRSLISARLRMQSADQSLVYAEQRLTEYRKLIRDGTSTLQDLLNAENDLIAARNFQLEAVESFAYAVTLMWRNIGVLLDRQQVHIDTTSPEKLTRGEPTFPSGGATAVRTPASAGEGVTVAAAPEGTAPVMAPPATPEAPGKETALTLLVGMFVVKVELAAASEKVRAAGLEPTIKDGPKTMEPMTRLLLGNFRDQTTAQKELDRLRKAYANGFILGSKKEGYFVYGGSYFNAHGADQERQRLAALGITVEMAETSVPVPTYLLTVGSFPTRQAAGEAMAKLQRAGLKVEVVEAGR